MRSILFLCAGLLLFSCNNRTETTEEDKLQQEALQKVEWLLGEQNLIRGIAFDYSPDQVKDQLRATPTISQTGFASYQLAMDDDATNYTELGFGFNKDNQLDVLTSHFYVANKKLASPVLEQLIQVLEGRYGPSQIDEDGWHRWMLKDTGAYPGEVEILLNKMEPEEGNGIVLELAKMRSWENPES